MTSKNYISQCKKQGAFGQEITKEIVKMFIVETQVGRKWKREPIVFADVEEAEKYAEVLYKDGKTVRVVDERYRK